MGGACTRQRVGYAPSSMRRINVVGTSCSGKTTLARDLAARLGLPHVEIDALYWGPGWKGLPMATFRARLEDALAADAWIADGGYEMARDITWRRAELGRLARLFPCRRARSLVASNGQADPHTGGVLARDGQP